MDEQPKQKPARVSIQTEATEFPAIPGSSSTINFQVHNQGTIEDYFELSVLGVPSTWFSLPERVVRLAPGEQRPVALIINAPPASEKSAGWYSMKIRATSQLDPGQSVEVEITLKVAVYEVQGRLGVMMHSNQFTAIPGSSISIPLVLRNQGLEMDGFRLAIDGIPTAWVSTSSPLTQLEPGEQKGITLNIHPPRSPQSRAGRHPFTLDLISKKYPDQVTSVECILTLAAFTQFTCELDPPEFPTEETARVAVINQGNIQQSYELNWVSENDALIFSSESPNPVRVPAGEVGVTEFTAAPRRKPLIGGQVVYSFSAQIKSAENELKTLNGKVTSRGLVPVWVAPVVLVACLLFACVAAFLWTTQGDRGAAATQTAQAGIDLGPSATQTAAFNQTAAAAIGQQDDDGDGLTNQQEAELGTNPQNPDTDNDELSDGDEVNRHGTNPLNPDTDTDELTDGDEGLRRGTDPKNPDTDCDGLRDGEEVRLGTDPKNPDTDGDGLNDSDEVRRGTSPLKPDTDGDGLNDGDEVRFGTNPLNPDTDNDRLMDGTESANCPNFLNPDSDGDGIIDGLDLNPCDPNNPSLTATAGASQPTLAPTPTTAPPTSVPPTQPPPIDSTPNPLQGTIAFQSNRDGNAEIYASTADTNVTFRLTNHPAVDMQPAWSPDGSRIAFTSNRDGNNEIYLMSADGSNLINLTNHPADDQFPAWSPDGSSIVFTTDRDGNQEIYVMGADGSQLSNLSNHPASDSQPSWFRVERLLASDEWIAFTSDRDGNQEIYTMHANGLEQVNISLNSSQDNSPRGNSNGQIAFNSNREGNFDIYLINLDGAGITKLTTNPAQDLNPTWSLDNNWIAFTTDRDGNQEIYTMRSNGADALNFSRNPASDTNPAWR